MKQIYILSSSFYEAYPHGKYKEILYDSLNNRPYLILSVLINNVRYGILFRTNPTKVYSYILFNRIRHGKELSSGLDFAKSIVIIDDSFVGDESVIHNQEWKKFNSDYDNIVVAFEHFLNTYKNIITNGVENPDEDRLVRYSSL